MISTVLSELWSEYAWITFSVDASRFSRVSGARFGLPVVPEVCNIRAVVAGCVSLNPGTWPAVPTARLTLTRYIPCLLSQCSVVHGSLFTTDAKPSGAAHIASEAIANPALASLRYYSYSAALKFGLSGATVASQVSNARNTTASCNELGNTTATTEPRNIPHPRKSSRKRRTCECSGL